MGRQKGEQLPFLDWLAALKNFADGPVRFPTPYKL